MLELIAKTSEKVASDNLEVSDDEKGLIQTVERCTQLATRMATLVKHVRLERAGGPRRWFNLAKTMYRDHTTKSEREELQRHLRDCREQFGLQMYNFTRAMIAEKLKALATMISTTRDDIGHIKASLDSIRKISDIDMHQTLGSLQPHVGRHDYDFRRRLDNRQLCHFASGHICHVDHVINHILRRPDNNIFSACHYIRHTHDYSNTNAHAHAQIIRRFSISVSGVSSNDLPAIGHNFQQTLIYFKRPTVVGAPTLSLIPWHYDAPTGRLRLFDNLFLCPGWNDLSSSTFARSMIMTTCGDANADTNADNRDEMNDTPLVCGPGIFSKFMVQDNGVSGSYLMLAAADQQVVVVPGGLSFTKMNLLSRAPVGN
ncbi:hypothetical protein Micbo1qcDRAFT_209002 [Microdochium bolleyi]|uniref:Uncharacterized protein n=1 Tax=Microdochium bolleyi TaxID=196109 RepID=A0A136INT1_9PEZI|nr:hypothetical protein Micbo1qcDRAFT_209002 [Microdochium bolleyi]